MGLIHSHLDSVMKFSLEVREQHGFEIASSCSTARGIYGGCFIAYKTCQNLTEKRLTIFSTRSASEKKLRYR